MYLQDHIVLSVYAAASDIDNAIGGDSCLKLWMAYCWMRDAEPTSLIVAATEEEALAKWKIELDEWASWYICESVEEVSEIEGYKVVFRKGKKISLEQCE